MRVSLKEITDRQIAERRAYLASDECKAADVVRAEQFKREEAAREKWEAEHGDKPHDKGGKAYLNGDARDVPDDIAECDEDEWLAGWDAQKLEHEFSDGEQ